jgi:hypothetical protein
VRFCGRTLAVSIRYSVALLMFVCSETSSRVSPALARSWRSSDAPQGDRSVSDSHRVERPGWHCREDGDEWPCHLARKALTDAFVDDFELPRHMARLQLLAAEELAVADPASLYGRFVRWTEPTQITCGRCEKSRHRALAGLPPRLFPCHLRSR